jgi:hypothetical protein
MLFQILHIRSTVKELKEDPGKFAGGQASEVLMGILILPLIIVVLGLAFLFILAFTHVLGGPYLFFKIIFFLALFVSAILGIIVYKLTSLFRRNTKKVVNKTKEYIIK